MPSTTNSGPYSLNLYTDNPVITLNARQGGSQSTFRYNWLEGCASPGSGSGYAASASYVAPVSCSIPPRLTLTVTPGTCNPATNLYDLTGTLSLTNAITSSLTITDGSVTTSVGITAGQTTASFSLTGLTSGSGTHTVTLNGVGYPPSSTTITDTTPFAIVGVSTINCTTLATGIREVRFNPKYVGLSGQPVSFSVVNETLPTTDAGPYSLKLYTDNPVITLSARQGSLSSTFRYNWLDICNAGPSSPSASITVTGTVPLSVSYTAPASCLTAPRLVLAVQPESAQLATPGAGAPLSSTDKFVDKSKAKIGDVLTYTLVLTNNGTTDLINTVVRDSSTVGLAYVDNSATAPAGTTFTPGAPASTWTIADLAPGQSITLTFQAKVTGTGILYNSATIPGDTAVVCTSVPVIVCPGSVYSIPLTASAGHRSYRWFRNGVEIRGQTSNILTVTTPGSYSLITDGASGKCTDFSCCPFIVEEDTLPSFRAQAVAVTCVGNVLQNNGKLVISGFNPAYTYQYSMGSSFNSAASTTAVAQPIPADGVLASNLVNPVAAQAYTVRIYNGSGCYNDVTVQLLPTVCGCPTEVCVPFVIRQSNRSRRIGDSR